MIHEIGIANYEIINIDQATIFNGSMNFTKAAEEKNGEKRMRNDAEITPHANYNKLMD